MNTNTAEPLSGKSNFQNLIKDKDLIQALERLEIKEPSEVQISAIPLILAGKDLVVEAQTGSGKTLAFLLPLLSKLKNMRKSNRTAVLVVTPTRELAAQIQDVVRQIAPDIRPATVIGGASPHIQLSKIRKDGRLVIGTPGRLLAFIRRRQLILDDCRTFVLDEADEMLSMGFMEDVRKILNSLPKQRQGLLFSATISPRVTSLSNSFLRSPEKILIKKNSRHTPKIEHLFYKVEGGTAAKATALYRILSSEPAESAIVFCNTKADTELVEVFLKRRGLDARRINSDLTQRERDRVMTSLREGELKFLIATDVAARGIDIQNLGLVINYSLHKDSEVYVHRTGRTGRAGAHGKALSLISPRDHGQFYQLKRHLGLDLKEMQPLPA